MAAHRPRATRSRILCGKAARRTRPACHLFSRMRKDKAPRLRPGAGGGAPHTFRQLGGGGRTPSRPSRRIGAPTGAPRRTGASRSERGVLPGDPRPFQAASRSEAKGAPSSCWAAQFSTGGTSSTFNGRNRVKESRQLPNQRARTSCRMKSMIGKTTMDRKPVNMQVGHGHVGIFVRMSLSAFNPTMALLS